MARALFSAAALLLLCACMAQASRIVQDDAILGRELLQAAKTPNCSRINEACDTCRNQRIPGTRRSELVCSTCKSGYRLRRDGTSKICDCAPGLAKIDGKCDSCPAGKFCLGGDANVNPNNEASDCPLGLATTFTGAKSQAQCFTTAGYGRVATRGADGKVTLSAEQCAIGSYNVGQNTAGCQKCGSGLTTEAVGATSSSLCVAPPGSYMDKGIGKLCQKGTYSTSYNNATTCTTCPTGITTSSEGTQLAADCKLAIKGYYLVDATTAAPCPLDTYNDQEAAITQCTQCPNGWKTKDTGATGLALCLAPPGWELLDGATTITECPNGKYKADWNRNPCVDCGVGLITAATGSVSKDACLVPRGFGLTQNDANGLKAEACANNYYGDNTTRPAVANARCTPCPADMFTMDTLGVPRGSDLYTSEEACKVKPGWGTTSTVPQACPKGTYNAGNNRLPCTPCIAGMTTTDTEKTSVDQCVIQPGWKMGGDGIPAPCDKGTFSVGGNETAPNATCSSCDTGFSTQEDESVSASECMVCAAGYGASNGQECAVCDYGTYASGGAAKGDACIACAEGTTSRRRASQSQMCYSKLIDVRNDVFNLGTDAWVAGSGADAAACGLACWNDNDCAMYRFNANAATDKCQVFKQTAGEAKTIGFKIGSGDDYATYTVPATQTVGVAITSTAASAATDVDTCVKACTDNNMCELFSFASGTCTLSQSELDQDYVSNFAVRGAQLLSDSKLGL